MTTTVNWRIADGGRQATVCSSQLTTVPVGTSVGLKQGVEAGGASGTVSGDCHSKTHVKSSGRYSAEGAACVGGTKVGICSNRSAAAGKRERERWRNLSFDVSTEATATGIKQTVTGADGFVRAQQEPVLNAVRKMIADYPRAPGAHVGLDDVVVSPPPKDEEAGSRDETLRRLGKVDFAKLHEAFGSELKAMFDEAGIPLEVPSEGVGPDSLGKAIRSALEGADEGAFKRLCEAFQKRLQPALVRVNAGLQGCLNSFEGLDNKISDAKAKRVFAKAFQQGIGCLDAELGRHCGDLFRGRRGAEQRVAERLKSLLGRYGLDDVWTDRELTTKAGDFYSWNLKWSETEANTKTNRSWSRVGG